MYVFISPAIKTYITCYYAHGYIPTPCILINFQEIVEIFSKNGFNLVFKSPCPEEVFEGKFDKNIPKNLHIQNASNLIFRRFDQNNMLNKALYLTAIPLCLMAAGELDRQPPEAKKIIVVRELRSNPVCTRFYLDYAPRIGIN